VASFVGFVPAHRPALVVLAALDTPRGARNQGGDVAAPLFERVAEHALRQLGIPADDPERSVRLAGYRPSVGVLPAAWTPAPATPTLGETAPPVPVLGVMPDLRGLAAREAAVTATRAGLVVELHGSGRVVEQRPDPGTQIEPGRTCLLRLDRSPRTAPSPPPTAAAANMPAAGAIQ
jgi:hypothetical protein